jgi:hypothetical protein
MFAYVAIPLTCWLCALLARPRRPCLGNEVQELAYARLLGRQQWLMLLAFTATMALVMFLILRLPTQPNPDLSVLRQARSGCDAQFQMSSSGNAAVCYETQSDGRIAQKQMQDDGSWLTTAILPLP